MQEQTNGKALPYHNRLMTIIDMLYAVVFGFTLIELYTNITNEELTTDSKVTSALLMLGVFYLILWDWIQGMVLTERNPYVDYSRFFQEIVIAFSAFGALYFASQNSIYLLLFIAFMLYMGSRWCDKTIKEYADGPDKILLNISTVTNQGLAISALLVFLLYWYKYGLSQEIMLEFAIWVIAVFLTSVIILEMLMLEFAPEDRWIPPGLPFLNRNRLLRLTNLVHRVYSFFKGGH